MKRQDSLSSVTVDDHDSSSDDKESYVDIHPHQIGCLRKLGDFNNVVKAFIGSSYLSMPFGFYQSGIVLGAIALVFIVAITDHCCQLIVKCKKYLVEDLCDKFIRENSCSEDLYAYRQRLQKELRYADIGRLCFGKVGVVIVDIFLLITQTGFCIAYFIFIGSTLLGMFPLKEVTVQLVYNVTPSQPKADIFYYDSGGNAINGYHSVERYMHAHALPKRGEIYEGKLNDYVTDYAVANDTTTLFNTTTGIFNSSTTVPSVTTPTNLSTPTTTVSNVTTMAPDTTPFPRTSTIPANHSLIPATNTSDKVYVSSAPDLKLLVLVPLIPFILFSWIRNIRKLGTVSLMANIAIFIGYFAIIIYMLVGFKVDKSVELFRWSTFPVFFGQVVCAFEGIGLVLPVEASMEENQKKFPFYLHGALFIVAGVLSSFGVVGYLRYGIHVQQVIVNNLPPFSYLSLCVDACLIIAIACTYPLQVFPVVEILEKYIFRVGKVPDSSRLSGHIQQATDSISSSESELEDEEEEEEFDKDSNQEKEPLIPRNQEKLKLIRKWKKNLFRTFVVLVIAGLSVLLRDNFAYINAFVGACGSTALAYILPCLFHLKIKGRQLSRLVIMKDIIIIIIGVIGGVVGVFVTVQQIISSF